MSAPDIIIAEVGKFYMVPCLFVPEEIRAWNMDEWVPVMGTQHGDPDINFPAPHYHIDWRFVSNRAFVTASMGPMKSPHGKVVSNTNSREEHKLTTKPVMKRRLCKRAMPNFPDLQGRPSLKIFARLEMAQQGKCNRLKDGHICPHRGFDLRAFVGDDGTAICPGHGLRWNLTTGEMIPRYTAGGKS